MFFLKFALLFLIGLPAFAEYRFTGHHPYKVFLDKSQGLKLSICYDNFRRCTGTIKAGSLHDLSLFLQRKIWRRSDVTVENYQEILKESQGVLKKHLNELRIREREIKELTVRRPEAALALRPYLEEARVRVRDAETSINYLKENKLIVDRVLKEVQETLSSSTTREYSLINTYNFESYQWRNCSGFVNADDCFISGMQYYFSNNSNDYVFQALAESMKMENHKNGYPQLLAPKLKVALLSTDHVAFGKKNNHQDAEDIPSELSGERLEDCKPLSRSGSLAFSELTCTALGKNWRYPTLKELQENREMLIRILPSMDTQKFLQTSDIRDFSNPGAVHLSLCKGIYYNPGTNKTLNNRPTFLRDFLFAKHPSQGVNAICVCSSGC